MGSELDERVLAMLRTEATALREYEKHSPGGVCAERAPLYERAAEIVAGLDDRPVVSQKLTTENAVDFAVTGCFGCPFAHDGDRTFFDLCSCPGAPEPFPLPGMGLGAKGDPAPDWCPLRKGAVLVTLRRMP